MSDSVTAPTFIGKLQGNADTATKLATSHSISLTGSVTGSGSFDGSGNLSINTSTNHTHSQYYDSGVSRTANTVLAAPNGSNGGATFRKLVAADIPSITKSKISDFPTSMPASDVSSWAKASAKPSYSWSEIGSKPTTFTPSSHTHTVSNITDFPNYAKSSSKGGNASWADAATYAQRLNKNTTFNDGTTGTFSYYDQSFSNTTNNDTWSAPSADWYQIYHNDLSVKNYWTELAFPVNNNNGLSWRQRRNDNYYGWYKILDSNNYKSYCTPANIGAATSSHNHDSVYIKSSSLAVLTQSEFDTAWNAS